MKSLLVVGVVGLMLGGSVVGAQAPEENTPPPASAPAAPAQEAHAPTGVALPGDYVIGPDDQLSILFWRDKELSGDVSVRPDGKITLPLLNEIQAAGLTPTQLREKLNAAAKQFVEDPTATVVVRQINSRKVFVTGQVEKQGPYSLMAPTTVLQLISTAGGLREYAKRNKIVVMRNENGNQVRFPFNYDQVIEGKNLKQNIQLVPGDTVLVP